LAAIRVEATERSDLEYWNGKVQNQQSVVAKTQNDLDYWTSQKNQLSSQLNEAQNRVSQLTAQVKDLESRQAQLQSSLDSDVAEEQRVESSAISKEAEANRLRDLVQSRIKEKSTADATLQKCEADMQKTKNEIDAVSYEINLVVVQPYLRWGGLAIFAVAIASFIVTTVGIATLVTRVRAGIGIVEGLPRRLRRIGPVLETSSSIETAEEAEGVPAVQRAEGAPVQVPAKPELTVIPSAAAAPEIVEPIRRRRPAAAKPRRKERIGKKSGTAKKAEGRS
jgi:hypothetical protein